MKYSIIIPHHNSSVLLRRLLDSIPMTLDIQIIVVDDNSTVEEFNAVGNLQNIYGFEFYKNEGRTAGGARNTGLKYAKGDWLIFSDSDDYFTSDFEVLVKEYSKSDADVVFFNVGSVMSDTGERAYRDEHVKHLLMRYKKCSDENYLRCLYLAPWGKMYKRNFVESNSIYYEERSAGNDMWFAVRTGVEAKKVEIDDRELYVCTVSSGSITTMLSVDRHEAKFQATLRTNNYLREHRMDKYQVSVLYFVAKAKQFGWRYLWHTLVECAKNRSNLLIGAKKILYYQKVLQNRQNPKFTKKV